MGTFSEMIAKTMFDEGAMATRGDSVPLAIDEVEWSDTDSSDEDGTPWEATQEDVEEDMKKWDAMMQERSAGKRGAVELMRGDVAETMAKVAESNLLRSSDVPCEAARSSKPCVLPKIGSGLAVCAASDGVAQPCSTWTLGLIDLNASSDRPEEEYDLPHFVPGTNLLERPLLSRGRSRRTRSAGHLPGGKFGSDAALRSCGSPSQGTRPSGSSPALMQISSGRRMSPKREIFSAQTARKMNIEF